MNEENMCIDYVCGKNRNHHANNIHYKTFEKFYLKKVKEKVYACSKCSMLIYSNIIYKCKECKKIYCGKCHNLDEHINNDKNNLIYIEDKEKNDINIDKKCSKCHKNICFCFECIQNVCVYCSNFHKKHRTISLFSLSQSFDSINFLNDFIKEKEKINQNLISSIDKWVMNLNKRLDIIKQKFKDQISLIKKITFNINPFNTDPIYNLNFWNLFYSLKSVNIEEIKKFEGFYGFEEQSKLIMNLLLKKEYKVDKKIGLINVQDTQPISDKTMLHKIDNATYLVYEPYDFNKMKKNFGIFTIDEGYNITLRDSICSISISLDKKEIYVCLSEKKIVNIYKCDLNQLCIKSSDSKILGISKKNKDHFNKCIQISSDYLATADDDKINIWTRIQDSEKQTIEFINVLNIDQISVVYDLFYINEKFFISFEPYNQIISFIKTDLLIQDKIIQNEKFSFYDLKNSILVLKDYIAINCLLGIALIYVKTKEVVQFIDNRLYTKYICLDNSDSFYVITYVNNNRKQDIFINEIDHYNFNNKDRNLILWGIIEKYKLIDGTYEIIENYGEIYSYNSNEKLNFIYINNCFVYDRNRYIILEEIIDSKVKMNLNDMYIYKMLIRK